MKTSRMWKTKHSISYMTQKTGNVTFTFKNIDDDKIYFNNTVTTMSAGFWEYDFSDLDINDSGDFNLHIVCRRNPETERNINFSLAWGNLTSRLITPAADSNVVQNKLFTFTTEVSCVGGECGGVNASAYHAIGAFGTGDDGPLTVTAPDTIVNNYTSLTTNSSTYNINVSDSSEFSVGDEILIIQMQNYSNSLAGTYEFAVISSMNGYNLTLDSALKNSYYSGSFNSTSATSSQIIRVPQYTSLTVNSGASIVPQTWDGYVGGILVFKATGTVNVIGSINSSARGFRGGDYGQSVGGTFETDGASGESYEGIGSKGTRNPNHGGGGAGCGDGTDGGCGGSDGDGAAGGGYGTIGSVGAGANGGLAGTTYNSAEVSQLILGSGGGGGGADNSDPLIGGSGGEAGGLVYITANTITVSGTISSDGRDGYVGSDWAGSGGGGSGGSVYLRGENLSLGSDLVTAAAGSGGAAGGGSGDAGGDGGVGRVRLDFTAMTGSTSPDSGFNSSAPIESGTGNMLLSTTTGDTPFYTTVTNPMDPPTTSCLSTLFGGQGCNTTWSVNATGLINASLLFFVAYNPINYTDNVSSNLTESVNITIIFLDETAPVITSITPSNFSYSQDPVTLTADTNEAADCEYSTTITFDYGTGTPFTGGEGTTAHTTSLGALGEGDYTYYIKCNDTFGNNNTDVNQGTTTFTVDNTPPSITLNYPEQGGSAVSSLEFNWTTTDVASTTLLCNLTLDGVVNESNIPAVSGSLANYSVDNLAIGSHDWNVTCWDNASNKNTSTTQTFEVFSDNAVLNATLITPPEITTTKVNQYDFFWVNATVTCVGSPVQTCGIVNGVARRNQTDEWWNRSWDSRTKLTFNNSGRLSDLENFTFLVTLDSSRIDYSRFKSDGSDIRFIDPDGTILDFHAELWDSSGVSLLWVQVPQIDSNSLTDYVYIYYNNSQASSARDEPGTYDDDFVLVQHLNESPANGVAGHLDSTQYGNDGTPQNFPGGGTDAKGIIDGADDFDGTDDYVDFGTDGSLNPSGSPFTYEIWLNNSQASPAGWPYVFGTGSTHTYYGFYQTQGASTLRWEWSPPPYGITWSSIALGDMGTNEFHYAVVTYDGTDFTSYFDGEVADSDSATPNPAILGVRIGVAWGGAYDGIIDEVRISNTSRSEPWVHASYYSVVDKLLTYGAAESSTGTYWVNISDTEGDTPLYTIDSQPQSCATLVGNSSCTLTWQVNASGTIDTAWSIDVEFTSDTVSMINTSDAVVLIADTVAPVITVVNPVNNTFVSGVIALNITTDENADCEYSTTSTFDLGVGTAFTNTGALIHSVSLGSLAEETYTYYMKCNDSYGNNNSDVNQAETTFIVDNTAPQITPTSPQDNSAPVNSTVVFNWTAEDAFSTSLTCNLSIDGNVNVSIISVTNATPRIYSVENISDGLHTWNVTCWDVMNNTNTSDTYLFVMDTTGPVVNLEYPPDGSDGMSENITFVYNVTDALANITNCTFEFQFVDDQSNSTIVEGYSLNFTKYNIPDGGPYFWRVKCYDNSTNLNIGYSEYRDFIVGNDTDKPIINLNTPEDDSTTSNNDVVFTYRVYDPTMDIANCTLNINNKTNITKTDIVEQGGFPYIFNNFTVYDIADANYTWSVNCTDTSRARNMGNSTTWDLEVIKDTDLPKITLLTPVNDYTSSTSTVQFYYTVEDVSANIENCSIIINGTVNTTAYDVPESTPQYFSIPNLKDGTYTWQINCTDDSFDKNKNASEIRNLTVLKLPNLVVNVSTDDDRYEKGTESVQLVNITTNVSDPYLNPLNSTVTTDVIRGNTSHPWWNTSWSRRQKLLIDNSVSMEDLYNFTLMVRLNNTNFNYSLALTQGADIRFIDDDGTTLLKHHFEFWNESSESILWVKIPKIDANSSIDHIWIYYNNSLVADAQDEEGTFDNEYVMVQHLQEAPANTVEGHLDSTKFNNDGTPYQFGGSAGSTTNGTGLFDGADEFDGANDYVDFGTDSSLNPHSSPFTYEMWINNAEGSPPDWPYIFGTGSTHNYYGFYQSLGTSNLRWEYGQPPGYTSWTGIGVGAMNTGEWHHALVTYDGTSFLTYFDGEYVESGVTTPNPDILGVRIGIAWGGSFEGTLDEIRISNTSRSLDWINATYRSGLDKMISYGAGEEWRARAQNDTSTDGIFLFNLSYSILPTGLYSAVSFVSAIDYNNATNNSLFWVVTDETAPVVSLINPPDGNVSATNDIVFYYNVTDTYSGIINCSLLINGTINQTNTTITEAENLNFSLNSIANGFYQWTVMCTDDYGNQGNATARNITILEDSTAPKVMLVNPPNGWNDTDANVTLFFNISDETATADCTLYLNGSLNETKPGLVTDGTVHNFTLENYQDGDYSWFVNCSDISTLYNISSTRNFTILYDGVSPVVNLESPANGAHLTIENVTFYYNVTDAISNITSCSLYINGTINQTNTTIIEDQSLNFTVRYLDGDYNWSIECTDGSENSNAQMSEIRDFKVAPDTVGPGIRLEYPPDDIELPAGSVMFMYNVTDFASGVENCTLYINDERNVTNSTITEVKSLNFTISLSNGDYEWYVNCTDDSPNSNHNSSVKRNLTIGLDETSPTITLISPVTPHTDTDGSLVLIYQVLDYASDIANCSLIINNKYNHTNTTTITQSTNENFTISGLGNGFYNWSVNCTDTSSSPNTANSDWWNFTVGLDEAGPTVSLISPPNHHQDTDGDVVFFYNVTDTTGIMNCSLIINSKYNTTNTTAITGNTHNFTLTGLEDGQYNWTVNCTDNSDNHNEAGAVTRNLTVNVDDTAPQVFLLAPPDDEIDNDGLRSFYYNVTDALSNISSCVLSIGGTTYTNTSVTEGVPQHFTVTGLATNDYPWNVTCTDGSDNSNQNISETWNLSVLLDLAAPVVNLETPENYTQYTSNTVLFTYNVSDTSSIANCSLIINGSLNVTNSSIVKDTTLNFTLDMASGTYLWSVNCTDESELNQTSASDTYIVVVGPDVVAPTVSLMNPPDDAQDTDGNVVFEYNVTDFGSSIANCSLIFNGNLNKTTDNPTEDTKLNFTLTGIENGDYTWQVNCTDNASNSAGSAIRNLTIGVDETAPTVTLVSPDNNSIYNSENVLFEYSVFDYASDIANCSLIIDGDLNQTNTSITESTSQYFALAMPDGTYEWSINCTDTSTVPNTGVSVTYNISVVSPKELIVDVYTNRSSIEQGRSLDVTTNTTNTTGSPLDSEVYSDIIRGNATTPWWDTSWKYRIPISINSTNVTRIGTLVEYSVNFTDVLRYQIGNASKVFEVYSVRVAEWANNRSKEIPSEFLQDANFNKSHNADGTVLWILNSTTPKNTIRTYYIYFDVEENGAKSEGSYSEPTYTFSGTSRTVSYDGSSQSADSMRLDMQGESVTLQFSDGQSLGNQQNIDFQGAGSLWNISVQSNKLTNYYDSIVPIAVYDNYYLTASGTPVVQSGPVTTRISIPGYLNASPNSPVELNYTIWFTGSEIRVKASLLADFDGDNSDPFSMFNNLWFTYLFDYDSDWSSYIHDMNSSSFNQRHRYHAPSILVDTTNQFNTGDWYSENFNGVGSLGFFAEKFGVNEGNLSIGIVSYDDYYNPAEPKVTESDGVGFNYNSDTTITASDIYNISVWMVFSANDTYGRALELREEQSSPLVITSSLAQTHIYRSSDSTGSDGIHDYLWSTAGQSLGWYTAASLANKSLYRHGSDHYPFVITADITNPTVTAISPGGWINYSDVTFTYWLSDLNPNVANCSLIVNDKINRTNSTVTNDAYNIFRITLGEGEYNWSVNCTDAAGNVGNSNTKNISIDIQKPQVELHAPENEGVFNYSVHFFNFTATDNRDKSLNCSLYLNSVLNTSVLAANATMTNLTLNLSDGVYTWYVRCLDDAQNANQSSIWNFSIDIGAPTIELIAPKSPDNYDADGNTTFVYVPSDTSSINNCSLIINGKYNQTNSTITNDVNNTFKLYNLAEGLYNWTVNCTDQYSREGETVTEDFYVDKYPPTIDLLFPVLNQTLNTSLVRFNFTQTDSFDSTLTCNLSIDNTVEDEDISAISGNITNTTVVSIADGFHNWTVSCWDSAGNKNTSTHRNFTIEESPIITLDNPPDNGYATSPNISFMFNVSDSTGIQNCTLVFDNKDNRTNSSISTSNTNNISLYSVSEGTHNWSITCIDNSTSNWVGYSETWIVNVEYTMPTVSLLSPGNMTWNSTSLMRFIYELDEANEDTCQLWGNFSGTWKANESDTGPSTGINEFLVTLPDGSFIWNVMCNDTAGNIAYNDSNWTILIDSTPPGILLLDPSPDSWNNNSEVTFNFTLYEYNPEYCELWGNFTGDWKLNQTITSLVPNAPNAFEPINLSDGPYIWNVWCNDSAGNSAWNVTNATFFVDTLPPTIVLNTPVQGGNTSPTVMFNFTATDAWDWSLFCDLYVDNKINGSAAAASGNPVEITLENMSIGGHNWSVTCTDSASNSNSSEVRTFNVSVADFVVLSSDIVFSDSTPVEGENITINATIKNSGYRDATNVLVRLYERWDDRPYSQIGIDMLVNITTGENTSVKLNWTPRIGTTEIRVAVDPANAYTEINENDNNASRNTTTSLWHRIFGNTTGNLKIGDSSSKDVYRWTLLNGTTSNIFITDSDASPTWALLMPLGRNSSHNQKIDDFPELDTALGTVNLSDSINNSFVYNGLPVAVNNFTVFKRSLLDVPVINSTNTSTFTTGILWDSNDLSIEEYNGTQDIVFVTRVLTPQQGAYAIVDYEIAVPAYLRRYSTTTIDSVTMYAELK